MQLLKKIQKLEQAGDFGALIALYKKKTSDHPRALAAYGRALAFCEKIREAETVLKLLPATLPGDPEAAIVRCLGLARLSRVQGDWDLAHRQAEEALDLARRTGSADLAADAEFALAICHVERGRLFLGLDLFEKISSDTHLSAYRRGLAASNASWILWDLGRAEGFKRIFPKIPLSHRTRHELAYSLLQGDLARSTSLLNRGLPKYSAPSQELQIANLLVLGAFVLGGPAYREVLKKSWVPESLESHAETKCAIQKALASRCLVLLDTRRPLSQISRIQPELGWRLSIECLLLDLLIALERGQKQDALRIYQEQINPIIDQKWLKTPLIPRLYEHGFEEETPWAKALALRLSVTRARKTPVLRLDGNQVIYQNGATSTQLNLARSPTSLKLLQILLEHSETRSRIELSKRDLHRRLTGSAYVAEMHDGRLLKLLSRLETKLSSVGIPRPWSIPGNNTVVVQRFRV